MGREVRRVPADWQHPKDEITGQYKPLWPGNRYENSAAEFMERANSEGLQEAIEWCGQAPDKNDYMPDWPLSECTHYMMYEDTSEGTPISPAFETPEELARWLADTGASAFGSQTASYEGWLRVARGGWAPSAVIVEGGPMVSGVEACL
ncbi:MAG: hypothetical protein WAO76_00370 [Georgfuchsia sp.]